MSDDVTTETTDADAATDTSAATEEAEAHRRRTIIRLLVGFGIGIPVLIELATFAGLIEQSLLGGDDGDGDENGSDSEAADGSADGGSGTAAPGETGVGVGDELLPETSQRETLTVASFRAGDDRWVLTLAAEVENTGSEPYTVQFASLRSREGRRVEGAHQPVTVPSGETGQVTGTWQLQPGTRPDRVVVRTAVGDADATDHEVDLGRIPLEGTRP
ncbi:hypothetical protein C2R22_05180 [Salinigranum rubrum]|uniref:Uncharacterized protein n=1 Tax=Salinigranum rubrum TaxID=755307 RepID=A0A2I8VGR1_9EURY|nr:hypothetical protein [Salinigranum rubrum]AUV81127.1 hypothetical protein C2R22_05180 [Salinigranum rubrum]